MLSAFADGGVISCNPSPHGGTWAIVLVDEAGNEVQKASGVIIPAQIGLPTVSNNYTELLAAVEAMERMPDGWDGVLHTDSNVTGIRLVYPKAKFNGIPEHLHLRVLREKHRLGRFAVVLLAGHPTKVQLEAGVGRHGLPVSRFNVACDLECGRLAAEFQKA